jgi:hypothetical protein
MQRPNYGSSEAPRNTGPFTDVPHAVVKTPIFEELTAALDQGLSPIFVTGDPGLGKTTLLRFLERHWSADGKPVCFIVLRELYRESDLASVLERALTENRELSQSHSPIVTQSSGHGAFYAAVDLVRSVSSSKLLLLLDGLDETRNPGLIMSFAQLVSREPNALVVVSSRNQPPDSATANLFMRFTMQPFSHTETMELLAKTFPQRQLTREQINRLYDIGKGSPLLANILIETFKFYDPHQLDETLGQLETQVSDIKLNRMSLTLLLERTLEREKYKNNELVLSLLAVLALRGSLSRTEIEMLGFFEIDRLASTGLVTIRDDTAFLFHAAAGNAALALAKVLPAADARLRNFQFGSEEAERDRLLTNSFIHPPGYDDLALGQTNIVVGDRGSGKSAIFSQLDGDRRTVLGGQAAAHIIRLTHPADMLKKLEAKGSQLNTAEEFRAGWLSLVAYSLAVHAAPFFSKDQRRIASQVREALGDKLAQTVLDRIWKHLRGTSIKVKLGPILLEPAVPTGGVRHRDIVIELSAFIRAAAKIFSDRNDVVIIALDRIDEIHKYDRTLQEKAVQGLFLAEGDLAQIMGVAFLIFIRSDLFKLYDIQEKNKLVTRTMEIEWSKDDLIKLLISRILSNEALSELKRLIERLPESIRTDTAIQAIFPKEIENVTTLEWLWSCLANGNNHVEVAPEFRTS